MGVEKNRASGRDKISTVRRGFLWRPVWLLWCPVSQEKFSLVVLPLFFFFLL